jgi:hypothetical protein
MRNHFERVETRRRGPKAVMQWLRYSPDHQTQKCGSENYSGKKICRVMRTGSSPVRPTKFTLGENT